MARSPLTEPASPRFPRLDFEAGIIIFITFAFALFGLIIQTSAGQYFRESDSFYTMRMQAIYLVPAILAGIIAAKINLDFCRKYAWWILVAAAILLLAIFIPGLGRTVNGSRRWIDLVFLRLQVSDPAKIALAFVLSNYLATSRRAFLKIDFKWWTRWKIFPIPTPEARNDLLHGFLIPCGIIGLICGLIAIEPDLGTMMLCATVGFILLFVSGGRIRYILPTILAGIVAFSTVIAFWPNRLMRVTSFLNPEADKQNSSYQLWQAMTGFACGGTDGRGLGDGMQYRGFLPEAHTDCVFSVVGEEFGFFKTIFVPIGFLILFLVIVSRLRKIPDVFYFNLGLSAALFVVLQAIVNMGVVTGLLPTKGMSLPFISYGGSNLVVMFIFIGIILNCMRNWRSAVIPQATEY